MRIEKQRAFIGVRDAADISVSQKEKEKYRFPVRAAAIK
jgi:hypothetical protein